MHKRSIKVLLLSPSLEAVSGVSTHAAMLMGSALSTEVNYIHFQVGAEGRAENTFQKIGRYLISPVQFAAALLRDKPDVVHINTSLLQKAYFRDYAYLIVARMLAVKVVTQIHGGYLPENFFTNPLLLWLLRQFLITADQVTVLSSEELESYRAFDPRINVRLVPNAIECTGLLDTKKIPNVDQPLRLVYIGRLARNKGIFEAIAAVRILKHEGIPVTLRIAGVGPDESDIRTEISCSQLSEQITLLGPVFGEKKIRCWIDSDVFVFPTYQEGLPYSLLESMAAGCVPIVSPVGAIPDVMSNAVHGLFVRSKDAGELAAAIRRLAEDRRLLLELARRSQQRIEEFYTVDRLAEDFREIYHRLYRKVA